MICKSCEADGGLAAPGVLEFGEEVREYYRTVLRRLGWPGTEPHRWPKTMGITSCCRGEGVSTVAAQLAVTASRAGDYRVLLVDANMAHPSLETLLGAEPRPGLAEVLLGQKETEGLIQALALANLSFLAAGEANGNLARAYDSSRLSWLIESWKGRYDLVLFDMPPVGQASSAIRLARLLDGVLLVVEAERVRWEVAQRAKRILADAQASVLGAILNKRRHHVPAWLYRTL